MVFVKLLQNGILFSYFKNLRIRARTVLNNEIISKSFKNSINLRNLSGQSRKVFKIWVSQLEYVFAYRIRKGQQLICIYSRFWNETTLKEIFKQFRYHVLKNRKDVMLGIVGASLYDWKTNRITDEEMNKHFNAFDYAYLLKEKTITCASCKQHQMYEDWSVFIEKKDMVVWRRPHSSGNFEYKVYGNYNDVSGEDFLNVQIDTKYRKEWDNTVIALDVVETDPNKENNSDIVYWELQWPKFFSNRDYVFNRRFTVDCDNKIIVIISKSTSHPSCPVQKDKFRVVDYFSAMVVKPYTELNQPGIEFVLTYFDNPGVNIPNSVNSWVAMRAMPEFLTRLREATKHYRAFCDKNNRSCICTIPDRGITKRKRECRKTPKPVRNEATSEEQEEVFGISRGEIERIFESVKDNVENKLDDIKDDLKKALSRLKEDLYENSGEEEKRSDVNTQTDFSEVQASRDVEKTKSKEKNTKEEGGDGGGEQSKGAKKDVRNKSEEVLSSPSPLMKNEESRKSFKKHFYPYYHYYYK